MAQFNLDDYEPVDVRIKKVMKAIEGYRIETYLRSPIEDITTVVFEARLFDGDRLLATGWAHEKAGDGYVNKTSHLENCETSAIGRALANYGYSGDKRPSREEMKKSATDSEDTQKQVNTESLDKGREMCMAEIARLIDTLSEESHDNYVTDIDAKHDALDIAGLRKIYAELKSKPAKTKDGPTIGAEADEKGLF